MQEPGQEETTTRSPAVRNTTDYISTTTAATVPNIMVRHGNGGIFYTMMFVTAMDADFAEWVVPTELVLEIFGDVAPFYAAASAAAAAALIMASHVNKMMAMTVPMIFLRPGSSACGSAPPL